MRATIRADNVTLEGYVNAIERRSRPITSRMGRFVERICKGAFTRAIGRNEDVRLLLNHDWKRDLGGTKDGTLELIEDSIGLRARATVTDREVIEKARNGDLVGWSFGFTDRDVDRHEENGVITRDVKDMNLFEVSILDRSKIPAYDGTLVYVRSDDDIQFHGEPLLTDIEIRSEDEPKNQQEEKPVDIDYSKYDAMIASMKGVKNNE